MPEFVVTDPNGKEFVVTAPEGTSQDDVLSYAKSQFGGAAQQPEAAAMTKTAAPNATGNAMSAVTENPYVQGAAGLVKKAALPMAGQAAGLYAGTALGGPVGAVVGESIGGGVGEMANQMAGITEPSLGEVGLAAISGPVGRGVAGALKLGVGSVLRGIGGRQNITDIASEIASKIFGPKTSSHELFESASKVTGVIPTSRAAKAVDTLLDAEKGNPSAISASINEAVGRWKGTFQTVGTAATGHEAQKLATYAQDLRLEATAAYAAKNHRLGNALNDLRGALFDDAAASGVPVFSEAAKAFRREVNVDKLGGILRQANPVKAFDDVMGSHAPKDKLFKTEFSDSEQVQIKSLLKKMTTVAPSGFSGVLGRTILAGGAATALTGPLASGAGAVAGWVAPDIAAYALSTKVGRNVMEKLLVGNVWDAPKAAALTQFVRARRAEDVRNGDTADAVKAALKSKEMNIDDKIKAALMGSKIGGVGDLLSTVGAQ